MGGLRPVHDVEREALRVVDIAFDQFANRNPVEFDLH